MDTPNGGTKMASLDRYTGDNLSVALTSKKLHFKRDELHLSKNVEIDSSKGITLVVGDQRINVPAHVLASNSKYFEKMLTDSFLNENGNEIVINIEGVTYTTLDIFIQFFYTSSLTITALNVKDLLIGSNILLLDDVREACVDYLKSMINFGNCIDLKDFASTLHLNDLYDFCLTYLVENFRFIANTEKFLTITSEELMLLIKSDDLFAKEKLVYDTVMTWIKHEPKTRSKYSAELLWYVRLPLMLSPGSEGEYCEKFTSEPKIFNVVDSFRMQHRKPFRQGILLLSSLPNMGPPQWYDATSEKWQFSHGRRSYFYFQLALSPPRMLCTCILLNDGSLIAVGGCEHNRGMKKADIFNRNTHRWSPIKDMQFERVKPNIVQIEHKVFVVGGFSYDRKSFYNMMEYYDLNKKKWYAVKNDENAISSSSEVVAVGVNELIYIIGPDKCGFFNPLNNKWSSIAPIPKFKKAAAICSIDSTIYVIGGYQLCDRNAEIRKYSRNVWAYCTKTNEWTSCPEMNHKRSHSAAVVMNGIIYVFGGKLDHTTSVDTFEMYNPQLNEWILSDVSMNHALSSIDAIVIEKDGEMYNLVFADMFDKNILQDSQTARFPRLEHDTIYN